MQKFSIMHGMQCINNWRVNCSTFWIWSHHLVVRSKAYCLINKFFFSFFSIYHSCTMHMHWPMPSCLRNSSYFRNFQVEETYYFNKPPLVHLSARRIDQITSWTLMDIITFSTRVDSGERFCAITRIRISFELKISY